MIFLSVFFLASSNYVGAERCQGCHQRAFEVWQKSAHARAMVSLASEQKTQQRCTLCHTLSAEDQSPRFVGVQCESCHGPGKYYLQSYVMKDKELARAVGLVDVGEQTCKRCHDQTSPSLVPFNYAEAWKRIAHGQDPPPAK